MWFGKNLLILGNAAADAYQQMAGNAWEQAARANALRIAFPSSAHISAGEDADFLLYDENDPFPSICAQLSDETHFLLLGGETLFLRDWDQKLLFAWRALHDPQALFTGHLWSADTVSGADESGEYRYSEVCLPALRRDPDAFRLCCGLPVVHTAAPVRTLLADPAFCFGPVSFLKTAGMRPETMAYHAFAENRHVFVPCEVPLVALSEAPMSMLYRPPETRPGSLQATFCKQLFREPSAPDLTVGAQSGLFSSCGRYETRSDLRERLDNGLRDLKAQKDGFEWPLLVTWVSDRIGGVANSERLAMHALFCDGVRALPLQIYTEGSQAPYLQSRSIHTMPYPKHKLQQLNRSLTEWQKRTFDKLLLMHNASELQREFTHVCWMDADAFPYPVHADTMPDLSPLTDDRIHIATVNEVPDPSFITLPVSLLPQLIADALYFLDRGGFRDDEYSEMRLWQYLYQVRRAKFCLHPMPEKRLLLASALPPALRSARIRYLLSLNSETSYHG